MPNNLPPGRNSKDCSIPPLDIDFSLKNSQPLVTDGEASNLPELKNKDVYIAPPSGCVTVIKKLVTFR